MQKIIYWFRKDLRLADNPALHSALKNGSVLPIYILDIDNAFKQAIGGASRVWLHYSLLALDQSLQQKLHVFKGDAKTILQRLIKQYKFDAVYYSRSYEPWCIKRDKIIEKTLSQNNITIKSFQGSLLWEPWEVLKDDGLPYKVFTPYFRKAKSQPLLARVPLPKPNLSQIATNIENKTSIDSLGLLTGHAWETNTLKNWQVGEKAAQKQLNCFIQNKLNNYKEGRNYPARQNVSRLSPHLHFGEISPTQIICAVNKLMGDQNSRQFVSELGWREFSYYLLYHFPSLPVKNLQTKFNAFPWSRNSKTLLAWQEGMTGYPFVDAGMRELWQTGYMHNRLRMVVASFLVKNLRIHWHHGQRWFWDCLFDADLANNSASWQWVAGCGTDAAPYFRIFNPVTQGEKFDPKGDYTKKYLPELSKLPIKYLFCPWEAPQQILENANITLGLHYPQPIVELKASRQKALDAYRKITT